MNEKDFICPFTDNKRYNSELNGGNGFTLKEIVIDIQKKLDNNLEKMDRRISLLERWRSGIVAIGSFCLAVLAAWKAIWK